jgi:hypothetical protein
MELNDWQFDKKLGAKLEYGVDWTTWLAGDTISQSTWTVPVQLSAPDNDATDSETVIWLEDNEFTSKGATYTLVNEIVTVDGRRNLQEMYITIT